MAPDAQTSAPELGLDPGTQAGFVKWFNGLPQSARPAPAARRTGRCGRVSAGAPPTAGAAAAAARCAAAAAQDAQVVRFFDRKGFYSVHGDAALAVAREHYRTTAVVKYLGGPAPSATPAGKAAPRGASTPGSGGKPAGLPSVTLNRALFEQASPGRLAAFEDALFRGGAGAAGDGAGGLSAAAAGAAESPLLAAVWLGSSEGQRLVGVAFLDAAARRLGACELPDDDHFCCLESLLLQLGVREVALPRVGAGKDGATQAGDGDAATPATGGKASGAGAAAAAAEGRRLRDALARVGVMGSEVPRGSYATKNLEQDLGRLLQARGRRAAAGRRRRGASGSVEQHRDVLERPAAAAALAGLLAFASLGADASGHHRHSLALYDPGQFMRLDAAAVRALNVLPSRLDGAASFSLYGIMCRARTPMGRRLLKTWLKAPLVDAAAIRQRLDIVGALVGDAALREALRDAMRGLPDIERLTRKLEARRASLADLCQLYRASSVLPRLEEALRCHEGPAAALLSSRYAERLGEAHDDAHLTKFELLLEASLDLEAVPHEYLIAPAYDPRLQSLRAEKEEAEAEIARLAAAAAKDLGLVLDKTLKLEWHKAAHARSRCLRITQKEEKAVRAKLNARYILLETRKDGTKFTNRALKEAAEAQADVSGRYEGLQRDLVAQVVAVAATFSEVWGGVGALLGELDVLAGFADLATSDPTRPYCKPTILEADGGEIRLKGSRHPCVEVQEGVAFVANDVSMVRGESWLSTITGPNMGGKSTFIRQVGCAVLMAQVGCFVAADEATIAPRDAIFARVGAGDCQQRGVSTFMAEMLETGAILRGASSRSLIIIDELGRGTSTYDGFGLAWAIAEHIMAAIGAPTLFATHFHELTDIAGPGGVANLHVQTALDEATGKLTMLYSIAPGACDQSFGIHVAESANFPPAVVAAAKAKLAELEAASAGRANDGTSSAEPMQVDGAGGAGGARGAKRPRGGEPGEDGDDAGGRDDAARVAAPDQGGKADASRARAKRLLGEFAALPLGTLSGGAAAEAALALLARVEAEAAGDPLLAQLVAGVR
ncbi:MUS1 [Scenedesmus sp. PABB004]|nr:MUS1 [Scenedesmus sp. PABB004]